MNALRNVHRMLEPRGLLVDMHPVMPNPRICAAGVDLGPLHQEEWAREWLRPTERELRKTVRAGLFQPFAELEFQIVHQHDDAQELIEEIDEWEGVWISPRVLRRVLASQPPIEMTENLVLRTYRAR